ncbi:MAG: DsbA family protein [Actinomycetota bacterium]|nr:DsbA family protein [Actinomycetota bacterium]
MQASFWIDPMCPWAWITSRWMVEVAKVRDVDVKWNIMSLGVLNEHNDVSEEYKKLIARTWRPARVLSRARELHGDEVVFPLFSALGTRFHVDKRKDMAAVIAESLAEVGLPAELAAAADDPQFDDLVRANHATAVAMSGAGVGTPVIAIDGLDGNPVGFFGPIITPIPRGEDAGRLWDGFVLVAQVPGVVEIKRARTLGPVVD